MGFLLEPSFDPLWFLPWVLTRKIGLGCFLRAIHLLLSSISFHQTGFFRSVLVTDILCCLLPPHFSTSPYWCLHFKLSESFFLKWSKIFSTVHSTKSLDIIINCDKDCLLAFLFIKLLCSVLLAYSVIIIIVLSMLCFLLSVLFL